MKSRIWGRTIFGTLTSPCFGEITAIGISNDDPDGVKEVIHLCCKRLLLT
jgi:hypothetical protein